MTLADRGMTLVELLVASALGVLLLTLVFWFLVPAMRLSSQGGARTEVQQQGVFALSRIEEALQNTVLAGTSLFPRDPLRPGGPVGLIMQPLEDVTSGGRATYRPELVVVFWDRDKATLNMETWRAPMPPGALSVTLTDSRPQTVTRADFDALVTGTSGKERLLAAGVADFDVLDEDAGPAVQMPLTLRLALERKTAQTTRPERFELTRMVTLRNR
ncbi:MAG: prepilin-type N-terminal cleavage/methylation domain-containing protein [Candidatus Eremiobacterota bacterium]